MRSLLYIRLLLCSFQHLWATDANFKKIPEFDMKIPEKFSGKIQITDFFPRMTKTGGKFRKSGKKSGFPENFPDFRKTDEYRSGQGQHK